MKLKFTCVSKNPPFALNADWQIDLEMVQQQGVKLKKLLQINASPTAAEIFEIGAEYELTITNVQDIRSTEQINDHKEFGLCGGESYIFTSSRETPNGGEIFGNFRENCPACSV
jgi:hypothetical protein